MGNIFTISGASDVLLEECYAWGWGKYVFVPYSADRVVVRRGVGRQDGWAYGQGCIFDTYSSTNVEWQNNIATDFDQWRHWHAHGADAVQGGFRTHGTSYNISYQGNIAMNVFGPPDYIIIGTTGLNHSVTNNPAFRFYQSTTEDNLVLNSHEGFLLDRYVSMDSSTSIDIYRNSGSSQYSWWGKGVAAVYTEDMNLTNSIIYGSEMTGLEGTFVYRDYNLFYNNSNNYNGAPSAGTNDYCSENANAIDPVWSQSNPTGGLKYPVRVESGSNLVGIGRNGDNVGAEIIYQYGVPGSLFGEAGYNELTDEELWPWENEDHIKDRFAEFYRWDEYDSLDPGNSSNPDTYVNGSRGFAAEGIGLYGGPITLTSYIWEYLGNACPSEICGLEENESIGNFVIDHTAAQQFDSIPESWIETAKENLHIVYQHTSHGSQLVSGMSALESYPDYNNSYEWSDDGTSGLDLDDYGISGASDLGYEDAWPVATRSLLDNPSNSHVNVVLWSWCNIAGHDIPKYLANMHSLIAEYPDVKFVYITGHANGGGEGDSSDSQNELIREYVEANGSILFDFADFENYDPDDNYFLDLNVHDNLDYTGGNWASEYVDRHNGTDPDELVSYVSSCAHSDANPDSKLNCVLKGQGAWYLFARLAGWDGNSSESVYLHDADLNTDNIINTSEVRYYISEWIEGSAQLGDLTNAIDIWKNGGTY